MPLSRSGMPRSYRGKSTRLGGGGRFAMLVDELMDEGYSYESAQNIAASIGRKRYGARKFASLSQRGRRRNR